MIHSHEKDPTVLSHDAFWEQTSDIHSLTSSQLKPEPLKPSLQAHSKDPLVFEHLPSGEQGFVKAQYNLGHMYRHGKGVPQDYKLSSRWFHLAAEQGDAQSQHNIGIAYYKGDGLVRDLGYSHMWVNLASSNGHELAKENLKIIENKMTSSQIAEAQRLARECLKKNYKGC